jgi:hypothetical protein
MSNAKALHQLIGNTIEECPEVAVLLAEIAGVKLPDHDQVRSAPNKHRVRGRRAIETDNTVRLLHQGTTRFFAQVETQRKFSPEKLATLRAYHGSEVRNTGCGGHVFVLSPRTSDTRRFRQEEERLREELAFQVSYMAGEDLEPLAAARRPLHARLTAVALADLAQGRTDRAVSLLLELGEQGMENLAGQLFEAMLEECPDDVNLEEALSEIAMQRLDRLPFAQAWLAKKTAAAREEAARELEEAARELARARAEAAKARLDARRGDLVTYFAAKADALTAQALAGIEAATEETVIQSWLMRAYRGETAEQIFES